MTHTETQLLHTSGTTSSHSSVVFPLLTALSAGKSWYIFCLESVFKRWHHAVTAHTQSLTFRNMRQHGFSFVLLNSLLCLISKYVPHEDHQNLNWFFFFFSTDQCKNQIHSYIIQMFSDCWKGYLNCITIAAWGHQQWVISFTFRIWMRQHPPTPGT